MTKPIILLVHGMGTHEQGNATKEFVKGVNQAAIHLGKNNFDIEQLVDFREYNYSQRLDEIRQEAADYQQGIKPFLELMSGGGLGSIVSILTEMEANFGEDEFIYTHWLDVVYYGLTYHNEEIRIGWATALADLIREDVKTGATIHVVAHSLGTAVVHDALAKLYKEDVTQDDSLHLSAKSEKLESLWMIANVSRLVTILTKFEDPHKSIVHDSDPQSPGCAKYFYNVRNKFDPFLLVKTFNREIESGRQIIFDEIRKLEGPDIKVNPHDLTEYMACPEVTRAFLYRTLGLTFSYKQTIQAMESYRAESIQGKSENAYSAIEDFVKSLGDVSAENFGTIKKAYEASIKAVKVLSELAE